jgi:hypothetical protein
MANQDHIAIVRQGLEVWNNWRKDNPEVRPDLSGADLTWMRTPNMIFVPDGIEFSVGINFSNVDLGGADLSGSNLTFANFKGANLSEASLRKADLYNSDFEEADLSKALLARH